MSAPSGSRDITQRQPRASGLAVHPGTPVACLELSPGRQLAVMLSRCTGSSAYLMNRRAAQAYLRGLLPMSLPYAHVFDQGWRFGLKVRLVTPTPCGDDEDIASSIVVPAEVSRKFHWTRRLSAYAYAYGLGNGWCRLRYGLISSCNLAADGAGSKHIHRDQPPSTKTGAPSVPDR